MKKIITILITLILTITLVGCTKDETEVKTDALDFKNEYESVNKTTNASGKEHRSVSISEDNPFVYASAEEIVEKVENGETFYVYFGSKLCPWCRSVIEKAIEVAKENNVETIYYVDIWDDEGNEILRDRYILEDGTLTLDIKGTNAYYKLLSAFDNVLSDYTLTDDNGSEVNTNEKRIYAPNFIYVENGDAASITEGISDKQTDSREELTEEILKDEEALFTEFFKN